MTRRLGTVGIALLLGGLGTAPASSRADSPPAARGIEDRQAGCPNGSLLPTPQALGEVLPPRQNVTLDVLVVTDPADLPETTRAIETAARAFNPLRIRLTPTFRVVPVPELDGYGSSYLEWLKSAVGGTRPPGFDVVYLATRHRISAVGQADCIGGVAYDSEAFAVGMLTWTDLVGVTIEGYPLPQGPPVPEAGAKIAAHEIGHLLGAHHHFGQCGPGMPPDDPVHPCDVMLTVSPQNLGLYFGPVTGKVIRHYAMTYARQPPRDSGSRP